MFQRSSEGSEISSTTFVRREKFTTNTHKQHNWSNMATPVQTSRINTFMVNFSEATKKPKIEVITDLIFNKIKIPSKRVKSFQFNGSRGITYVECDSLEYAQEIVENHDRRHEVSYDNMKIVAPLLMDDGATVVKLHDLPPQMDNEYIKHEMGKYGEVLSIKSEVWEAPVQLIGIPSGVRKMRIRLITSIPSYIFIAGHSTLVSYKNQQITCRHCGRQVHYGAKCAEAVQIVNAQNSVNNRLQRGSGYADVVQGPGQKRPAPENLPETNMVNLNMLNKKWNQRSSNTTTDQPSTTDTGNLIQQQSDSEFKIPAKTARVSNIIGGSDGTVNANEGTSGNTNINLFDVLMSEDDDKSAYFSDCSQASESSKAEKRKSRKSRNSNKTE